MEGFVFWVYKNKIAFELLKYKKFSVTQIIVIQLRHIFLISSQFFQIIKENITLKEAKLRQLLVLKLAVYKQVRDIVRVSVFTGSLRQIQATCREAQRFSHDLVFFWSGVRYSKDGAGENWRSLW